MKKIVITECPYCKSNNLALGFQTEKGSVYADIRGGVFGSQIEHIICKECGSIIYSRVVKPDMFKEKENTADLEISVEEVITEASNPVKAEVKTDAPDESFAEKIKNTVSENDNVKGTEKMPENTVPAAPRPVTAKPMIFTINNNKE